METTAVHVSTSFAKAEAFLLKETQYERVLRLKYDILWYMVVQEARAILSTVDNGDVYYDLM